WQTAEIELACADERRKRFEPREPALVRGHRAMPRRRGHAEPCRGHRRVVVVARQDRAIELAGAAAVAGRLRGARGPVAPARLVTSLAGHSLDRLLDEPPVAGP